MKIIPLSKGKATVVDDDDYDLLIQRSWHAQKSKSNTTWYAATAYRDEEGKSVSLLLHRYLMNAKPGEQVDHKNGNGLDNRRANLRLCSQAENHGNRKAHGGVSKYKGVSLDKRLKKKKWRAVISKGGVYKNIGYFVTEEEAARAYDEVAKAWFGEFARPNFRDSCEL